MHIALLRLGFHLTGCRSLKEKRQRLGGLRDKFGKQTQVAVTESGQQDSWQNSEWSFVVAGTDRRQMSQILEQIQRFAEQNLDAVIQQSRTEWL